MILSLPLAGLILERSALATGFLAAAIAVGGFVTRAQAALRSPDEPELQRATVVGGLTGLCCGVLIIAIDAVAG
jgi:hypothetical protein